MGEGQFSHISVALKNSPVEINLSHNFPERFNTLGYHREDAKGSGGEKIGVSPICCIDYLQERSGM